MFNWKCASARSPRTDAYMNKHYVVTLFIAHRAELYDGEITSRIEAICHESYTHTHSHIIQIQISCNFPGFPLSCLRVVCCASSQSVLSSRDYYKHLWACAARFVLNGGRALISLPCESKTKWRHCDFNGFISAQYFNLQNTRKWTCFWKTAAAWWMMG